MTAASLVAALDAAEAHLDDLLERAELARERSTPGPTPADIAAAQMAVEAAREAADTVRRAVGRPRRAL